MTSMNRVFLAGNLTRDPEKPRYTATGTAVLNLGLAVNESYRDKSGELKETTCFVDIEVWGRQAETCAEYLTKGSPVLVEGRLKYDQWESEKGEKRSKMRVRADRVQFLSAPRRSEISGAPQGGGRKSGAAAAPPQAPDESAPPAEPEAPPAEGNDDDLPF